MSAPPPLPEFADVYRRFDRYVWRLLVRAGVPLHCVDDARQDVFVIVHRRLPEFEGRAKLRTWIHEIARRVALDYRKPRRATPSGSGSRFAIDPDTPVEVVERRQALALLQRWLDELDPDKRRAFVLAELEGRPPASIAEQLRVNVNTIYARIRAARIHLARRARRTENLERMIVAYHSKSEPVQRRHAFAALLVRLGRAPTPWLGPTSAKLALLGAATARPVALGGLVAIVTVLGVVATVGARVPEPDDAPTVVDRASSPAEVDVDERSSTRDAYATDRDHASTHDAYAMTTEPRREVATPIPLTDRDAARIDPETRTGGPARRRKLAAATTSDDAPAKPVPGDPLPEQVAALAAAREAVREGRWHDARRLLAAHARRWPDGPLAQDVLKLDRVVACRRGEHAAADRIASELARRFGHESPECR